MSESPVQVVMPRVKLAYSKLLWRKVFYCKIVVNFVECGRDPYKEPCP
jgi:hypothetical protein